MDASVLTALVVREERTPDAFRLIRQPQAPFLSTFAAVEVASAISRRVRTRELTVREADTALELFDLWTSRTAQWIETSAEDIHAADPLVRRFDLKLRTGDATHAATALRLGAGLATFDGGLADAARALGITVLN